MKYKQFIPKAADSFVFVFFLCLFGLFLLFVFVGLFVVLCFVLFGFVCCFGLLVCLLVNFLSTRS